MFEHARIQAVSVTLVALAGAVPGFGQTITSIERVNSAGESGYTGGVYFPNRPKVEAFTLTCPSDTFSKEIMSEATVVWNASAGTSAGVEWGPVQASVEARMGVEIGEKKTITRTYSYGPIPWYSRRYCIFVSYGKFRIKGTDRGGRAFDMNIFIPEGTFTKTTRVAPDCPCEEVSRAASDAFGYADSLPPMSPAHALVTSGAAAIESAGSGGYEALAIGLTDAVGSFTEAVAFGADEAILNDIMLTATMALEVGVQKELDYASGGDPASGGAYTDPGVAVSTDAAGAASDFLVQASAIAHSPGPLERWFDALQQYGMAVQAVFQVGAEIDASMAESTCATAGGDPRICCRADLDEDGRLTIFDFLVFQNLFVTGDAAADFDGDGSLTLFDFLAFQNEFDAGCL